MSTPSDEAEPVAPKGPEQQPNIRPSPINGVVPPAEHQWRPGQSGNPGGRPRGKSLTSLLREQLARVISDDGETMAHAVAANLVQIALKGDKGCPNAGRAIRDIFQWIELGGPADAGPRPRIAIPGSDPRFERDDDSGGDDRGDGGEADPG
jgi:hypothetical protein